MIRLLISAPASGCGKTAVACALLRVLCERGFSPCAFKCGPDYIARGGGGRGGHGLL